MQEARASSAKKSPAARGPFPGTVPALNNTWITIGLLAATPFLSVTLVPAAIFCALLNIAWSLVFGRRGARTERTPVRFELAPEVLKRDRALDVVLYGVTGYTGRLAALYLATNYKPDEVRWGIAGRSQKRLEEIRNEVAQINPAYENLPIFIAECSDAAALKRIATTTRAIASTVGPFSLYGETLVATCAAQGTDYLDITGEGPWVAEMIEKYGQQAHITGARLVHMCGLDSIPWDLTTLRLANEFRRNDSSEKIKSVRHFVEMPFNPSGGTLYSIGTLFKDLLHLLRATQGLAKGKSSFYSLIGSVNEKSQNRVVNEPRFVPQRSATMDALGALALTEAGNLPIIVRSNALLAYNESLVYNEEFVYASCTQWFNTAYLLITFVLTQLVPPLRWALQKYVLRKPGEGPTKEELENGFLTVTSEAVGTKGTRLVSRLHYPKEAGYAETARMLVESALTLKFNAKDLDGRPGGFYTTASLQGEYLLDRLIQTGCEYTIQKK